MKIRLIFPWFYYPKLFIKFIGFTPRYIDSKYIRTDKEVDKIARFSIWQLLVTNVLSLAITILICYFTSSLFSDVNRFGDWVILSTLSVIVLPLPLFFFFQGYLQWLFFVFSSSGEKYFMKT